MKIEHRFESFALSIGLDETNTPVCVVLTCNSIPGCTDIALGATACQVSEGDLLVHGAEGERIRMMDVDEAITEALGKSLPLVILDPSTQRNHLVSSRMAAGGPQ